VGRYVILDCIGSGGMGVVYAAYDPELDRKVAIKLLRSELGGAPAGGDARTRLLREAQALARLSHPNVIGIHDVGTLEDRIFIAMEHVDGVTLGDWLRQCSRDWREITAMFAQAARGLGAAHQAGVVHRDFKPHNVMVDGAGRARVLDFGLARAADAPPDDEASEVAVADLPAVASPRQGALQTPLTGANAFLGTPAYMAPEQFLRRPADAKSDQFSFCAALYEALFGQLPFEGATLGELEQSVLAGRVRPPPRGSGVPGWLRPIVLVGLGVRPETRHPAMEALADALARDPALLRRRWLSAGVALLATSALAVGLGAAARRRGALCRGAEQRLAGAWDAGRRQAVHAAFLATGRPFAEDTFARTTRGLDQYAAAWKAMHTDACEATRVRGEQSDELLDLRMQCLGESREELGALVDVFARADGAVVERAVQATARLSSLARCADVPALRAPVRPPADPRQRAEVDALRSELARLRARRDAGRYADGIGAARAAAASAEKIGYRPLVAEALLLEGSFDSATGDSTAAARAILQAVAAADASRHDRVGAQARGSLVAIATNRAHYDEAEMWVELARAAVERGGSDAELTAQLATNYGSLLSHQGKSEPALAEFKRALALDQQRLGADAPDTLADLLNVGVALSELARDDESIDYYQRALAGYERALGADHPRVALVMDDLANTLAAMARYDQALVQYQRALAIEERAAGPSSSELARILGNYGVLLRRMGRLGEAEQVGRRALAMMTKTQPPGHPLVAHQLKSLAIVLHLEGREDEALALHQRALALREQALGPDHPEVAASLDEIGDVLVALGRDREALSAYRRSLAIYEKAFDAHHVYLRTPLVGMGRAQLGLHAPAEALPPLERALAICQAQAGGGDETFRAEVEFALARALDALHRQPARALELARSAQKAYVAAGAPGRDALSAVDAWLAARGATAARHP
jgi:tetratricopeptide (TPR) repeat protein